MRDHETTDLQGAQRLAEGDLGPTPGCGPPDRQLIWTRDALWICPRADQDTWWCIPFDDMNEAIRGHLAGTDPGGPEDQLLAQDLFGPDPRSSTSYFTFGFSHAHAMNGRTYDKDVVVKITAPDPRAVMFQHFGLAWSMEYHTLDQVKPHLYSRGVVEL